MVRRYRRISQAEIGAPGGSSQAAEASAIRQYEGGPRIPRFRAIRNPELHAGVRAALGVARARSPGARATGKSELEETFAGQIRLARLPAPVREHRFHPSRRWRMDFAYPTEKVAVEIEGGIWTGGRHTRGNGFISDCEKYNAAQLAGWLVLRVAAEHVRNGTALSWLREALGVER